MLFSRHTRRRTFIAGVGSAAAWPPVALGQPPLMRTIGVLQLNQDDSVLVPFRQRLKDIGYIEGQTLAIQYRSAQGRFDERHRMQARDTGHWAAALNIRTPRSITDIAG
jgi:hypothetical protein